MVLRITLLFAVTAWPRWRPRTPIPPISLWNEPTQALRQKNYDQAIAGFRASHRARAGPRLHPQGSGLHAAQGRRRTKPRAISSARPCAWIPPTSTWRSNTHSCATRPSSRPMARRIFDRIRKTGERQRPNRPSRTSTGRSPKASPAGRRRWNLDPDNFSAHQELARTGRAARSNWSSPPNTTRKPGGFGPASAR